jgi:acyl-CoA thioesterase FadM
MVRIYSMQGVVGNAEGDAWGQLPPSGVLRLFEQAAVAAAAEAGYDGEFHRKHGSAWIIRRMTLLMHSPAHLGDRLELSTWLSHVARVRGYREYKLQNLSEPGSPLVATGIAEWVYIDRETVTPKVVPREIEIISDVPGAPLGSYEPPVVQPPPASPHARPAEFSTNRVAEWYECDSMGHVNNSVYPNWLDAGFRAAVDAGGWPVAASKKEGFQLRGEHFALDYKRPALPGDRLTTTTRIEGLSGRYCRVYQVITNAEGTELLTAISVYGWAGSSGNSISPPDGWLERGFSELP